MISFSIIQKSQLEGADRLDAGYYQPKYIESERKVKLYGKVLLGKVTDRLTDYHANGSYKILCQNVDILKESNYALMVRATDLQLNNYEDDVRYVTEEAYNFLNKTKVFGGELIINKIGNAGEVYLMPKLDRPVTLGMNLFLLRFKAGFLPEYVYVYLNSKHGKRLIYRRVTGTVPTSIDKDSVRSIPVPKLSLREQKKVKKTVDLSLSNVSLSSLLYQRAEGLLLENLGIKDFEIPEDLAWVVAYSEVTKAERMDADYFQPKYIELLKNIRGYNAVKLGDLVNFKKGVEPGSSAYEDEGKLFIRVSSLSHNGIEEKDQKYLSEELYQRHREEIQPQVGEILLTKDATPGIAYVLKEPIDGIISGGILRLKLKKDIEPEYLALCLNSIVGRLQAERDAGGSVIQHWKPSEIKNVLIPVSPKKTQQKIADLVKKSHEARRKSKELLEEAKKRVEEMIERGKT